MNKIKGEKLKYRIIYVSCKIKLYIKIKNNS